MKEINYNITSNSALRLGRKYNQGVYKVKFCGFSFEDSQNNFILQIQTRDGLSLPKIHLTSDLEFDVTQLITKISGTFQGQIFEISNDGMMINPSKKFSIVVADSLELSDAEAEDRVAYNLWYSEINGLYHEIKQAYENGEFKGEKGDKGDKGDSSDIVVDSELSSKSTNPVQNKVIRMAIGDLNLLETASKTSLVSAINEIVRDLARQYATQDFVQEYVASSMQVAQETLGQMLAQYPTIEQVQQMIADSK